MLCLRKIRKSFSTWSGEQLVVLDNFSLSVRPGEMIGITGGNGTGKTTLLKIIAGLIMPDFGTVELDNRDITTVPHLTRSGFVRLVTQNPLDNLFPHLTVAENLFVADRDSRDGLFKGALSRQRLDAYKSHLVDLFPVLVEKIDDPVMLLSGGEIQLCALAVALMAKPKILLLDEFVSALSEENEQRAIHALSLFNSSPRNGSCAILIVSHERLILEKLGATIVTLDRHRSEEE